jgi:GT2 family glycosyltransferase
MSDERLSIVVLTHNRKAELMATLARLKQLEAAYPVYVVDNASSDDTHRAVAAEFPHVSVIRLNRNLGAAGRNHGVEAAVTPYVAFCDDDTWWAYGSLATGVRILDRYPALGVLTARILVGPEHREDPTSILMGISPLENLSACPGAETIGFMAGACVMRRDVFLAAGGYEQKFFLGGEERLLAYDIQALGWRLAYIPTMQLHHHPSTFRDAPQRRRLLLRNALWCAWMRRPWHSALRESLGHVRQVLRQPRLAGAVLEAIKEAPWAFRQRQVLPREVEARLRCVERSMR